MGRGTELLPHCREAFEKTSSYMPSELAEANRSQSLGLQWDVMDLGLSLPFQMAHAPNCDFSAAYSAAALAWLPKGEAFPQNGWCLMLRSSSAKTTLRSLEPRLCLRPLGLPNRRTPSPGEGRRYTWL